MQAEHVDTEKQWRKELHVAQMKEFEDRGKLIKLQENHPSEFKKKEQEMKKRDGSYNELKGSKIGKIGGSGVLL